MTVIAIPKGREGDPGRKRFGLLSGLLRSFLPRNDEIVPLSLRRVGGMLFTLLRRRRNEGKSRLIGRGANEVSGGRFFGRNLYL
ncbi:MAG: hypothetical protein DLD55_05540 [candidate division SR1 bacterium]|nr:MAG: hypothetical protein DLD55_05540 [candidate division SR1 bacterium]